MNMLTSNRGIQGGYDDPIFIGTDTTVVVEKIVYRGSGGTLKTPTERVIYRDPVFPKLTTKSQDSTDIEQEISVSLGDIVDEDI